MRTLALATTEWIKSSNQTRYTRPKNEMTLSHATLEYEAGGNVRESCPGSHAMPTGNVSPDLAATATILVTASEKYSNV